MASDQYFSRTLGILAVVATIYGIFFASMLGLALADVASVVDHSSRNTCPQLISAFGSQDLTLKKNLVFDLAAPVWIISFVFAFSCWLWQIANIDVRGPVPVVLVAVLKSLVWPLPLVSIFCVYVALSGWFFGLSDPPPTLIGSAFVLFGWILVSLVVLVCTETLRYFAKSGG